MAGRPDRSNAPEKAWQPLATHLRHMAELGLVIDNLPPTPFLT
jgi:hypothetical protein